MLNILGSKVTRPAAMCLYHLWLSFLELICIWMTFLSLLILPFLQVEHKFYIPRQAQNWIIGPKLVKGTELNKPIKEFGIVGEGVTEVNVFMYVMHTKKAQVPNEATRMRHQQFNQQQQLGRQLQAQVDRQSIH